MEAFLEVNAELEATLKSEMDAMWKLIRSTSGFEEFRVIGVQGASIVRAAKRSQGLNNGICFSYRKLFLLWNSVCEEYSKSKLYLTEDVEAVARIISKNYLRRICVGIPQDYHNVLAFYAIVLYAKRDDRISHEITEMCLTLKTVTKARHETASSQHTYIQTAAKQIVKNSIHQAFKRVCGDPDKLSFQSIVSGKSNRKVSASGKRHRKEILQLISRIPQLVEFEDVINHMGMEPKTWLKYAESDVKPLRDIPDAVASSLNTLEKLVFLTATHGHLVRKVCLIFYIIKNLDTPNDTGCIGPRAGRFEHYRSDVGKGY